MLIFLVFGFGLLLIATVLSGEVLTMDISAARDGAVIADQMLVYHGAASRACSGDAASAAARCPPNGAVKVDDDLPSYRKGVGAFADGRIRSFSVKQASGDEYVVTYLADASGVGLDERGRVMARFVATKDRNGSTWMGRITNAKVVKADGERFWQDPKDGGSPVRVTAAAELDAASAVTGTVPADAPAIVTRFSRRT